MAGSMQTEHDLSSQTVGLECTQTPLQYHLRFSLPPPQSPCATISNLPLIFGPSIKTRTPYLRVQEQPVYDRNRSVSTVCFSSWPWTSRNAVFPSCFEGAYHSLQNKTEPFTSGPVCTAGSLGKPTDRSSIARPGSERKGWPRRVHRILLPRCFWLLGHWCRHSAPSFPPRHLILYSPRQAGILGTSKGYQIQIR